MVNIKFGLVWAIHSASELLFLGLEQGSNFTAGCV